MVVIVLSVSFAALFVVFPDFSCPSLAFVRLSSRSAFSFDIVFPAVRRRDRFRQCRNMDVSYLCRFFFDKRTLGHDIVRRSLHHVDDRWISVLV